MAEKNKEKLKIVLLPIEESVHTRIKILNATKKITMRSWTRSKILEALIKDEKNLEFEKEIDQKSSVNQIKD